MGWGGGEAGGGLHHPIGLFGVAMSPRSASHRPRHDWRALRDVSPTRVNIRVWPLAGPIKCNWPSVTLWSVFQYPVTYKVGHDV